MDFNCVRTIAECPSCGCGCKRRMIKTRRAHDIDGAIVVRFGVHYCSDCNRHFAGPIKPEIPQGMRYTRRLAEAVVGLAREENSLDSAIAIVKRECGFGIPRTTVMRWVENGLD